MTGDSLDALGLELLGGLDTLPGGSNLDENTLLLNADSLVKSDELLRLLDGSGSVERVDGVNLGRDTAGDDGEDSLAELDEETVGSGVGLGLDVTVGALARARRRRSVGIEGLCALCVVVDESGCWRDRHSASGNHFPPSHSRPTPGTRNGSVCSKLPIYPIRAPQNTAQSTYPHSHQRVN
jgi:hypothetical protein